MKEFHSDSLEEEADQYKKDKEKIRKIIGGIGGKRSAQFERIINWAFFLSLVLLCLSDVLNYYTDIPWTLPTDLAIQIGILLVSVKIIRMIYLQTKVEHFQFWILNSIEFRLTEIDKRIQKMDKMTKQQQEENKD